MAISSSTVWELRTTGADTNGGGYVAGSGTTDYSQQDAAQLSVTDADASGTTNLHSSTGGFTAAMVGNVVQISGGTLTAGFYQITARVDANNVTLDRTAGTGSGSTAKVGGALSTFNTLATAMAASNKAWVKSGAYTSTATTTFATTGVNPSATVMPNHIIGYMTTRGDIKQTAPGTFSNNSSRPTLTLSTNTGLVGLKFSNNGWYVENLIVDCANLGTSIPIELDGSSGVVVNCLVKNFTLRGLFANGTQNTILYCEATGGGSSVDGALRCGSNDTQIIGCYVHDNACPGIFAGAAQNIAHCLIINNTGASSDGISLVGQQTIIKHNTIYGNGRHGINLSNGSGFWFGSFVRNNVLVSNGGYGLKGPGAGGTPAGPWFDGNFFYNNTSGTRNQIDDTSTNAINGETPYTNVLDVILTASPFTSAGTGDFSLNNTAGGGAAVRGAGTPGTLPGSSTIGYADGGAFQHLETSHGFALVGNQGPAYGG